MLGTIRVIQWLINRERESCYYDRTSLKVRPLPPVLAEKARLELNEDPQRLPSDLQHIKDWIARQNHLNARTDDQWLTAFLRGSKFSLERAKEKIDLYYSVQTTSPDLFALTPKNPRFWDILELGAFLILPQTRGPGFPKLSIIRPGKYDASKVTIAEVMSVKNTLEKILFMEDDDAVISGETTILDLEGVTLGHFMQMTPLIIKKIATVVQDAAPLRMKGVHCLNTPPGFETIFNAMKSLLNEKNRNRLYVHNRNYEEMYKYFPKDILPVEYGGNGSSEKEIIEYWRAKVKEYDQWLEEDVKYGTDESKRPNKVPVSGSAFGADGAFRKLEVD